MKPRARLYDPFAAADAWTPRPAKPVFAHTAANSAFLPTQGAPTQVNLGSSPSREAQQAERSPLEAKYPGMAMAVTMLWGYPEMNDYFSKLWLADENSEPIDPDAMADLMLLARLHQHLAPARSERTMASIYGVDNERFFDERWQDRARR